MSSATAVVGQEVAGRVGDVVFQELQIDLADAFMSAIFAESFGTFVMAALRPIMGEHLDVVIVAFAGFERVPQLDLIGIDPRTIVEPDDRIVVVQELRLGQVALLVVEP